MKEWIKCAGIEQSRRLHRQRLRQSVRPPYWVTSNWVMVASAAALAGVLSLLTISCDGIAGSEITKRGNKI